MSLAVLLLLTVGYFLSPSIRDTDVHGVFKGKLGMEFESHYFMPCGVKEAWWVEGENFSLQNRYNPYVERPGELIYLEAEGVLWTDSKKHRHMLGDKHLHVTKIIRIGRLGENECDLDHKP